MNAFIQVHPQNLVNHNLNLHKIKHFVTYLTLKRRITKIIYYVWFQLYKFNRQVYAYVPQQMFTYKQLSFDSI